MQLYTSPKYMKESIITILTKLINMYGLLVYVYRRDRYVEETVKLAVLCMHGHLLSFFFRPLKDLFALMRLSQQHLSV